MQNSRISGIRMLRGTFRIFVASLMVRKPKGSINKLARKKTMNTEYIATGLSIKIIGPGLRFFMYSTPITMAVIESPGIPKTSAGIHAPAREELLAAPASMMPSGCPVPNFSGSFENFLLIA